MELSIEKRFLSFLLAFIMVFSLLPWSAVEVFAALSNTTAVAGLTITSNKEFASISGTTVTIAVQSTEECDKYTTQNEVVTFTNTSGQKATLSFESVTIATGNGYAYYGVNVSSDPTTPYTSSVTKTFVLESNEFVKIKVVSSNNDTNKSTVTLSGITLTPDSSITTTFKTSANGSYMVDGKEIKNNTTLSKSSSESYAVTVTPQSGYKFFGWYNETTGRYVTYTNVSSLTITAAATIYPVFIEDTLALFGVGADQYFDLNTAVNAAKNGSTKTVVLLNNGTLPAGDYEVSSGVTLLIPFDDANTCYTSKPVVLSQDDGERYNGHYGSWDSNNNKLTKPKDYPTVYRKLTMADGARITVNGAMSLSNKLYAPHSPQYGGGSPIDNISMVEMLGDSKITVNGSLYCWGYIIGTGDVIANPTANIYECFQFNDWRGGSFVSSVGSHKTFLLSQYYVQNIEVPMTIKAGAKITAGSAAHLQAVMTDNAQFLTVPFFGGSQSDGAMFTLTSGYAVKDYDEQNDRLDVKLYGTLSITSMTVKAPGNLGSLTNINTANYHLPINSNITMTVCEGSTVSIQQDILLLPGAEMTVDHGATVALGNGIDVYAYDWTEWGGYAGSANLPHIPLVYSPGRDGYRYSSSDTIKDNRAGERNVLPDAMVDINGMLDASAGHIYTTSSGANITSSKGTGVIKVGENGTEGDYQYQHDGKWDIKRPTTPAMLLNGNGEYVTTAGIENTTFIYCATHKSWNDGCCVQEPCGHTFTDDGDCTTAVLCTICNKDVTAAKDQHAWEKSATENKHACSNDGCNQTIECADATTDGNHVCDYGCGKTLNDCADSNPKDHICDTDSACTKYSTGANAHTDGNDNDHLCDYGCGQSADEGCHDVNTDDDHKCDECGKDNVTEHIDGDDADHLCDNGCGKIADDGCHDVNTNGDHNCDECGKDNVTEHVDGDDANHLCDNGCGKIADDGCHDVNADGDHNCDE